MVESTIPHLRDPKTLRLPTTVGVRKVAKGIQKDVAELYESIVQVLVDEHADLFGDPQNRHHHHQGGEDDEDQDEDDDEQFDEEEEDKEWMYSLERFHWANSRHWHLPIPSSNQKEEEDSY
jgi:hypothetical protein